MLTSKYSFLGPEQTGAGSLRGQALIRSTHHLPQHHANSHSAAWPRVVDSVGQRMRHV